MYMFRYLYNNSDNIYLWLMLGVAALLSPNLYTVHTYTDRMYRGCESGGVDP